MPVVGTSRQPMMDIKVLFPDPEGPMMRDHLTLIDLEADAVQGTDFVITHLIDLGQVFCLDHINFLR